jgi:alpha-D-ribose 1-methylphosphonate 5-triphosphate synthase subunit PhnH
VQNSSLDGGFSNREIDAAYAFRALMNAMAKPGTVAAITGASAPAPLSAAASTALLTLCDADTPIYLAGEFDNQAIKDWIAFHIGAPISTRESAQFAVGRLKDLLPIDGFPVGTAEYPDRSTTLIVEMDELSEKGSVLSGPGIKDTTCFGLPGDVALFQSNSTMFPLGLDFMFTSGSKIAALPRTTKVA